MRTIDIYGMIDKIIGIEVLIDDDDFDGEVVVDDDYLNQRLLGHEDDGLYRVNIECFRKMLKMTKEELDEYFIEIDNKILEYMDEDLDMLGDWDYYLDDHLLEVYAEFFPNECSRDDDTDELVYNEESFERFSEEFRSNGKYEDARQSLKDEFYDTLRDNVTDEARRSATEKAIAFFGLTYVIAEYLYNNECLFEYL